MASLSAGKVEGFISKPAFEHSVYLVYGPDSGLVSERADVLSAKCDVDLNDPFSLLRIQADEIAADPGRLSDEANTIGMFGGKRLIRISGTTQKDLFKSIKPVLDNPPQDALIIVEAGDLKKSVALRRNLEAHKNSLCIPCYQDNSAALDQLISQEIVEQGLKIDPQTRQELKSLLGSDRRLSRNELAKLALYCNGRDEVTLRDVQNSVGDASGLILTELIDAGTVGNLNRVQHLFTKAVEAGNSPDIILLSLLRHLQILHLAVSEMANTRQSASNMISAIRPPIHFSRKNAVTQSLSIWQQDRLLRAMDRINTAMLHCRQFPLSSNATASTTLLAIALEARVLSR
ncbi:MAG: DNA polymerase III subunit delta [Pseudomonadota bacterium]